jgi:hypothetical protein
MTPILINFNEIISPHHKIYSSLSTPPKSYKDFNPGLLVFTKPDIVKTLSSLSPGNKRIDYINTPHFIENISSHFYILFNENKKICLLSPECISHLQPILSLLFTSLPPETILWVGVDISKDNFIDTVKSFVSHGFNSPFVTTISPLYKDISPSVSLTRQNITSDPHSSHATLNKVLHSIEQYKSDESSCYIFASLSENAVNFLKQASKLGVVIGKDGKKSQRELTGELFVKDVKREDGKFVYIIDIDKNTIKAGEEENVDVETTRYNFHSHPHEAYVRHSVKKAWPSVTDYLGYHRLGENTIFHCVASLEGVYVISFGPHWANRLKKVSRRFIDKRYDVDLEKKYTPKQYIEKINKIKYKNYPIFQVKFFTWNKANTVFKVFYPQIGSTCLPTKQSLHKYKKIYKK